jgi:hypothetical protein
MDWLHLFHEAAGEAMEHGLRPAPTPIGFQLEGRPPPVYAAIDGGAVEIAGAIEDEAAVGVGPIAPIAEAVQYGFCPAATPVRLQLEDRPEAMNATADGRAVEIAAGIDDQAGVGILSIRAITQTVKHRFSPAAAPIGCQLEHRTEPMDAAIVGGAVHVARTIPNQAGFRIDPIRRVGIEVVQYRLGPTAALPWR